MNKFLLGVLAIFLVLALTFWEYSRFKQSRNDKKHKKELQDKIKEIEKTNLELLEVLKLKKLKIDSLTDSTGKIKEELSKKKLELSIYKDRLSNALKYANNFTVIESQAYFDTKYYNNKESLVGVKLDSNTAIIVINKLESFDVLIEENKALQDYRSQIENLVDKQSVLITELRHSGETKDLVILNQNTEIEHYKEILNIKPHQKRFVIGPSVTYNSKIVIGLSLTYRIISF